MRKAIINATGVQYVRDHLTTLPRPDQQAIAALKRWSSERGQPLDPDQVEVITLHYQPDGARGYRAAITQRMTLTEAILANWQGESASNLAGALFGEPWAGTFPQGRVTFVDHLPAPGQWQAGAGYQVFNGLFRRQRPQRIDASTQVQIPAEAFEAFIWNLDLHSAYLATLDRYWQSAFESHRLTAKLAFVSACNKQVQEGSLSDAGRKLVWQAAGLMAPAPGHQACLLNVYGYLANDAVCISAADAPLTVLYLPGNSSPLLEFPNLDALRDWFGEQCQDADKRRALKRYFAQADRPDGLDFSGLDTALTGLGVYPAIHHRSPNRAGFTTDGPWAPRDYVHYRPEHYSPPITGELFHALTVHQKARSYSEADFIVTSQAQVNKGKWLGYLNNTLTILAPLAIVVPELVPLLAAGGVAQLGLGLDRAVHGKGVEQQAQGVEQALYGVFNAVPVLAEGLANGALFRVKSENFVPPSRINEQLGYPLSPMHAPQLPALDVAEYFHIPDDIPPLPGADETTANAVTRTPRYDGSADRLQAEIGGYNWEVLYDLQADAFIMEEDANEVAPRHYIARPGARALRPVPPGRVVTDEMRCATLRALGVDLPLPLTLAENSLAAAAPIPKTISSLWVGDKVIDAQLIANLARNADLLQTSQYSYRVFVSDASPAAFEENLRLLGEKAPGLQALHLEQQPFFQAFMKSKYYRQYQAALEGNGGVASNFASAADDLRFFMLDHDGGLYLDMDDSLRQAGENGDGEFIDQVPLLASPDGLVLAPPVCNEKLGMNFEFNTSMIGSHPDNPTLKAILEEMYSRYQATPTFYDSKPSLASDPAAFYHYASELSRLTGPRLMTDVLDRSLPALYRLRQLHNLCRVPTINAWLGFESAAFEQAVRDNLPLSRVAKMGGANSWADT